MDFPGGEEGRPAGGGAQELGGLAQWAALLWKFLYGVLGPGSAAAKVAAECPYPPEPQLWPPGGLCGTRCQEGGFSRRAGTRFRGGPWVLVQTRPAWETPGSAGLMRVRILELLDPLSEGRFLCCYGSVARNAPCTLKKRFLS